MYLKRLEIKGFKSFADFTEILLHPGINVIVGPNGCGKSNVVDAIRWVIGESNVRNLRGQKNEDVIFNGTDHKKALGLAQVEITIDNTNQVLPCEFSEVHLVRKLFRSGESEFFINRTRVRLKDVSGLFTGTGLGKKGYSIIGQGELEQVLNGQPLERRLFLEEASGIIKYRQQRDEVNRRISGTTEDLVRVGDLLGELEQRKEDVFVKAQKARQYLEIESKCRELERSVMLFEFNKLIRDLTQRKKQHDEKETELELLKDKLIGIQQDLKADKQKLKDTVTRYQQFKEECYQLETAIRSLQSDVRVSKERIKNHRERTTGAAEDHEKYTRMLESMGREIESSMNSFQREERKYNTRKKEYEELKARLTKMRLDLEQAQAEFEAAKGKVFKDMQDEAWLGNQLRELEEQQRRSSERRERFTINRLDSQEKQERAKNHLSQLKLQLKTALDSRLMAEQNCEELDKQKEKLLGEIRQLEEKYLTFTRQCTQLENSLFTIQEQEKNLTGYSNGVKYILKPEIRQRVPGIMGVMGELVSVPPGLETAIEVAAGRGLENIVVQKADDARQVIELLKRNKAGRVTFLPLEVLKVSSLPERQLEKLKGLEGVLGLASQLVKHADKYQKAVEYLLGRVMVVQDMDRGIRVFKQMSLPLRLVTLDGELINASGAMTGGTRTVLKGSPLQRKAEERRLDQQLDLLKKEMEKNRQVVKTNDLAMENLEQELGNARQEMMEFQVKADVLQQQCHSITQDYNKYHQEENGYSEQIKVIDQEIKKIEADIISLNERYAQVQNRTHTTSTRLEDLKQQITTWQRDYEVQNERLVSYQDQLAMKQQELNTLAKNLAQLKQVQDSYRQSWQQAENLINRLNNEINVEEKRIITLQDQIQQKEDIRQKLNGEIEQLRIEENRYQKLISQWAEQIAPLNDKLSTLQNGIHSAEIAIARYETDLDNLRSRWLEKCNEPLPTGKEEVCSPGVARESRQIIEKLLKELEQLGPVDVEAVQEYEEISKRYGFLNQQYQDLFKARDSLQKLLKETETIMEDKFAQCMAIANRSFRQTFEEIFSGGEARLVALESDDKLQAGVDIEVKMPGKKNQPLNLLSGGERALTCIAFIFALLRLKPAPFCILDEIDASLDETNLIRFTGFLRRMAVSTQFIVITHRQATIECTNSIYGVTMPEKGVSTVYTLNPDQAENIAG